MTIKEAFQPDTAIVTMMDSNEPESIDTVTISIPRKTFNEMVSALKDARELARYSPFAKDEKTERQIAQAIEMADACA